jgi:2,4-dienoyl-CoA reductase-like NADH-dependent reductase (Old Yellow Enzyme family)
MLAQIYAARAYTVNEAATRVRVRPGEPSMSRYFKYKTADDLARDAASRGLDLPLQDDWSPLLQPLAIGSRTVGNRLVIQPMEGCDAEPDGSPGPLTIRRYERFGAGGAKLIWGEACAVVPEGQANPRQLIINDSTLTNLARIPEVCREAHRREFGTTDDLLIGLQLTHSGRYCWARPVLAQHDPLLTGRTVMNKATGEKAGPDTPLISDDDLERLIDHYVRAARQSQAIGFDFVDIKQCHRYLLNELLASRTREGRFGGSYENRTRLIKTVVARIRSEVPGLMVASRMNAFDGVPYRRGPAPDHLGEPEPFTTPVESCWGTDRMDPSREELAEPLRLVGELKALGLDLLNITLGNPYASPHYTRPFEYTPPDGYETPEHPLDGVARHFRIAEAIQGAHRDLPIVGSGYSWLQAFTFHAGAANVARGRIELVGIGRNALSHPDFGRYAMEGRPMDAKHTCRTFSYCTALMRSKHNEAGQFPTGCPPFDKEVYGPIWKEAQETAPGAGK